MSNDINWGILSPLNKINPIKTASPMAAPAPMPSGAPQGGLGDDLASAIGQGDLTPGGTAGQALSSALNNDPIRFTQELGQGSKNKLSAALQTSQQLQNPQQLAGTSLGQGIGIPNIQAAAAQQFPNNPVMQQLAVAQATHESGLLDGKPSKLASQYNNIFGIKGKGANMQTHEYINGQKKTLGQEFQAYKSIEDSMKAYKELMQKPRYKGVLSATNFADAAKAVQQAGYATDPNYSKSLMRVNQELSHLKTPEEAQKAPTPYITGGAPIPKGMEKTPAFHQAITTYAQMRQDGVTKSPYVVSIDYSRPATEKRLSVINAETGKVVFQSEVAQGKGGFSNVPGSRASSLGTFVTTQTYEGKHGTSLRIRGLNPGQNDNVEKRAVVVHGADYIGGGKTGYSFGCFAVPKDVAPKLINLIKDGTIIQASMGDSRQT